MYDKQARRTADLATNALIGSLTRPDSVNRVTDPGRFRDAVEILLLASDVAPDQKDLEVKRFADIGHSIRDPRSPYWVLASEQGGEIVGAALITPEVAALESGAPLDHPVNRSLMMSMSFLDLLAVREDRRGQGIGSDLLRGAFAEAYPFFRGMRLDAHPDAAPFFRKHGMTEIKGTALLTSYTSTLDEDTLSYQLIPPPDSDMSYFFASFSRKCKIVKQSGMPNYAQVARGLGMSTEPSAILLGSMRTPLEMAQAIRRGR
ncbi:GNAT family N-acetyltransferase [Streptomyces sp. NPDC051546]|uniref:GNAT family N-acetyltransferase n=1 Tax=Streptomyces sp. NPDC051546 TaxID=3365655 RepID=UPI003797FBDE